MSECICTFHPEGKLASLFFIAYSRFECAMKKSSFRNKTKAEANWRQFIEDSGVVDFLTKAHTDSSDPELQAAVAYHFDKPAKKQVVNNSNELDFNDAPLLAEENIGRRVLQSVKNVRDNLFHGAKSIVGGEDSSAEVCRDSDLLRHGLVILQKCECFIT